MGATTILIPAQRPHHPNLIDPTLVQLTMEVNTPRSITSLSFSELSFSEQLQRQLFITNLNQY
jgi:hypothetical protein